MNTLRVGGIVLCGGQSTRMGRPKAWLPFAGEFMLPRIVRLLGEAVQPIAVVAAPGQEVPALADDIRVVRDEVQGRGPLQGLAAGLEALHGLADAAFVSSCDVPFLRPAFVRRLIDLLNDSAIAVPCVQGYHHPLAAVYRLEIVAAVRRLLAEDRLRPFFLFQAVPTRVVSAEELADVDADFQTLRNLNTPEEYEAALREEGKANAMMRSIHDLTTEETYRLVSEHFGHALPPLDAVENEDWGRDYVLQKLLEHTDAELLEIGLVKSI